MFFLYRYKRVSTTYKALGLNTCIGFAQRLCMPFFGSLLIEKCYIHNIVTTNYGWLVIIGSNLNLALRLLF